MSEPERVTGSAPPHDIEAEAAVISTVILDDTKAYLDEVRQVCTAEHFFMPQNRVIFEAVCALADDGKPTDLVTLANYLRSHSKWDGQMGPYLAQVVYETPSLPHVVAHATIVRDMYRVRRAILHSQTIGVTMGSLQGADPETIQASLEQAELTFSELATEQQQSRRQDVADVMAEVLKTLELSHSQHSAVVGVPTGYRKLDEMLTGLHDGDTTVIAGRPGSGKTGFALCVARNMADDGYGVLFHSLEMPAQQLGLRLLSAETGIDLNLLRTGRFSADDWPKIMQAITTLSALPLQIDDTAGATLAQIKATTRQFKREIETGRYPKATKGKLGAVFIDYAQLMRTQRTGRSREEEIESISHGCKQLAKDEMIHVVLLSQLNRELEKRPDHRPKLSDLRNSGALEQDADNVIFIHRPEMYDKDNADLKGLAEAIVEKQRNGPTGTVELIFRKSCTRFDSRAGDGYASGGDEYDDTTDDLCGDFDNQGPGRDGN